MDNSIENVNSTNDESLDAIMASTEANEERLAKLEEANKKLFARAKSAEEKLKSHPITNPTAEPISREELVLVARGYSEEDIALLKDIASLRKVPITQAENDPLYQAHIAKKETEKKSEGARFGASRSSAPVASTAKFTPDMSREDHMKAWREAMGG